MAISSTSTTGDADTASACPPLAFVVSVNVRQRAEVRLVSAVVPGPLCYHRGVSETDLERLRVFCDECAAIHKSSVMEHAEITYRWPGGDQNIVSGYVCPACGRQYTKLFGYRDEAVDSPRKGLQVPCACDATRPAMYIDHVRTDGGVGFRCWMCGSTKETVSPRAGVG